MKNLSNLGGGKDNNEVKNDTVCGKTGSNIDFRIDFNAAAERMKIDMPSYG